jgi:hypothetical protein
MTQKKVKRQRSGNPSSCLGVFVVMSKKTFSPPRHGEPGAAKPQPKKQNHRCTPIHTDSQKQPEKFAKPSQILDDSSTEKAKIGDFFGNQGGVKPPHSQKEWRNNLRERR